MGDLKEDIRKFISTAFPMARKHKITYDESLLETGIIGFFGVVELVNYLWNLLDIEIDDEGLTQANFQNITSIANLIERKKSAA
jgi:acyl carrier protein